MEACQQDKHKKKRGFKHRNAWQFDQMIGFSNQGNIFMSFWLGP